MAQMVLLHWNTANCYLIYLPTLELLECLINLRWQKISIAIIYINAWLPNLTTQLPWWLLHLSLDALPYTKLRRQKNLYRNKPVHSFCYVNPLDISVCSSISMIFIKIISTVFFFFYSYVSSNQNHDFQRRKTWSHFISLLRLQPSLPYF